MASLIAWLQGCGLRRSDGTPVASGSVNFMDPDTNRNQVVYADADETQTLTQPVPLDAAGRATVYAKNPVDVQVQDANNGDLGTLKLANVVEDRLIAMTVAGATGPFLADFVIAAQASFGGPNLQYLIAPGQTPLNVGAALAAISVNVKAFGAKGDGLALDATAVQAATNYVKSIGGGIVYFPPGTYLLDATVNLISGTGVTFQGAGRLATIIRQTGGALGAFTISGTSITFRDLTIQGPAGNTTGSAIAGSAAGLVLEHVTIGAGTGASFCFRISLDLTSASSQVFLLDTNLIETNSDGAARGIRANAVTGLQLVSSSINNASGGATMELIGTTNVALIAVSLNGGQISSTVDPVLTQVGSLFGSSAIILNSGVHFVPNLLFGDKYVLLGQSTGAAYVIDAPTPALSGSATNNTKRLTFILRNDSGAPITGWTFNAIFHRSATAISLVDAHRTTITFEYDVSSSVWREASISDST